MKPGDALARVLDYYKLIPDFSKVQKIICPFHKDVNPSMLVDLEGGRWFCFGCQMAGDALSFVVKMETQYHNLSKMEAAKLFFKILKTSSVSDVQLACHKKENTLPKRELYIQAYDYFHGLKKIDWRLSKDPEMKGAKTYMLNRGFTLETLNKTKAKLTYNKFYPVVFPMLDNGKFKGWVCRTNDPETEKKRKYLYNEGFSRATTLVGNYGSKSYVFVCEGYMDRLRFLQNGGPDNIVAILGWKATTEQIAKLKEKQITTIISVLDNDDCGRKGTMYLRNFFEVIRWPFLRSLKDVGESSKEQFERMAKKLKETHLQLFPNGL